MRLPRLQIVRFLLLFAICLCTSAVPGHAQTYQFGRADFGDGGPGTGMAAGDFNGDGRTDYAVLWGQPSTAGEVRIFLGQPDGTLKVGQSYSTGTYPRSVIAGDFNGDGKLDLAVFNIGDSTISMYMGNGDGTFSSPVTFSVAGYPWKIIAADFNGDGKLDLACPGTQTISILLGNGDGTFQPALEYATDEDPLRLAAADVNGDGKMDLVVQGPNNVYVWLGNGDGSFQTPIQIPGLLFASAFAFGDFNRDGKLDIAVLGFQNSVTILLGNGDGTFQQGAQYSTSQQFPPGSIIAADFNQDGKLDIAFSFASSNAVSVLLGNGDGTFQTRADYGVGSGPVDIAVADVNGDGHLDLVAADSTYPFGGQTETLSVLLGSGDGTFAGANKTFSTGVAGSTVQNSFVFSGDFNGDGKVDLGELIFDSTQNVQAAVSLSNGDGTFQPPKSTLLGNYLGPDVPVAVGDFNNDGKLDFCMFVTVDISGLITNQLLVFLGNGDGTFQSPPIVTSINNVASYVVGDFNGDGKLDIAYVTPSVSQVGILLGRGDGTFLPENDFATGSVPEYVTAADLNHDGKLDLIVGYAFPSTGISILLGRGDGTFPTYSNIAASSFAPIAVADVNGDGNQDLVLADQVLLGNGDGTFQTPLTNALPIGFNQLAIADMNGDGKPDIVGAYEIIGNGPFFSVSYGQGDGTFSSPISYAAGELLDVWGGYSTLNLVVADFNGDGATDLAYQGPRSAAPGITVQLNAPTVALYPTALNFGNQTVGVASGNENVTLYNVGVMPLTLSGMAAAGDFSVSDGCGSTLAIGANCTASVTFTPSANGARTGSLQVSDNAPGSPQVVTLTGTGTGAPAVTGLPANLPFASQSVGSTSTAQTVTLTNSGNAPLIITGIAASGDFAETDTCGSSVAASGSCTVSVTFTPSVEGSRSGTLTFTDNNNAVSGSTQSVALTGTGMGPLASLSMTSLTFAAQFVGATSAAQTVTLTNSGNAGMTITSIAASGDFAETNACGSTVAAGGNCTISVTFKPTAGGSRSATLTITDNAPGSPHAVNLTGTGEDFSVGVASGSSSSATVSPGQTATYGLNLSGLGGLNQQVTFTCTGAPSEATCTVSPSPATPSASGAVSVTVSVATTAPSLVAPNERRVPPARRGAPFLMGTRFGVLVLGLLGMLALWALAARSKPGLAGLRFGVALVALASLALLFSACGGGGGGGNTNPGTPAGTYPLTVTGTVSGSTTLQHSTTLTLQVS